MTRRDDLELSHGAIAKDRENAVKQDRVRVTNAIGHHPERSGFLRRTEFIGGTTRVPGPFRNLQPNMPVAEGEIIQPGAFHAIQRDWIGDLYALRQELAH